MSEKNTSLNPKNDTPIKKYTTKLFITAMILGVFIGLAVIIPGVSGSTIAIIFGLYLVLLLDVVLLDSVWFDREPEAVRTLNLVPFRIIGAFLGSMFDSKGLFRLALWNVGGNFVLFCPFALFLPLCTRWMGKWYGVLGVSTLAIVAVEAAQYISARGNADIDDVILNLGGVMVLWGILQIPPVKRFYAEATLCLPGKDYFLLES